LALELAFACPRADVVAFDVSRPSGSQFSDVFDAAELDIRSRGDGLRAAMQRVRVAQGSITSASDLDRALCSSDIVFNAAAYGMASVNGASVNLCHRINVAGVEALIDACARCRVRRIVHVSSTVAVFDGSPIVNGTAALPLVTQPHHGNHYGHTKALAEELLRRAADGSAALDVAIVRPNGIFGPNDNTHFPRLKRLLRDGLFNLRVGDGASLVDWIFIDNLSHALLCAAAADFQTVPCSAGSSSKCVTVHVSDEDPREMNHLFCAFAEALGYLPPSLYISTQLLSRIAALMVAASRLTRGLFTPMLTPCEAYKAGTHMVFSTADARGSIAWQPLVSYETGISMTVEYEHRKLLRAPPPPIEVPSLVWWLLIVGGMWLCWIGDAAAASARCSGYSLPSALCSVVVLASQSVASCNLNLRIIFYCAVLAHCVEAAVAVRIMRRMASFSRANRPKSGRKEGVFFEWGTGLMLAYVLQTFILGFPSLKTILRYNRLQEAMLKTGVMGREARKQPLL
jgi:nucleoside-diphosphate-sugar epimerase